MKILSISKFSGNEVYYTTGLTLLVKIMLCSKLQGHKTFKVKVFAYKILKCFVLAKPFLIVW